MLRVSPCHAPLVFPADRFERIQEYEESDSFDWYDKTFPDDIGETAAEALFDLCPKRVTVQLVVAVDYLHDVLSSASWETWKAFEHHRRGYDEAKVTDMDAYEKWIRTAGPGTSIASRFVCLAEIGHLDKAAETHKVVRRLLAPLNSGLSSVGARVPSAYMVHAPLMSCYCMSHLFLDIPRCLYSPRLHFAKRPFYTFQRTVAFIPALPICVLPHRVCHGKQNKCGNGLAVCPTSPRADRP